MKENPNEVSSYIFSPNERYSSPKGAIIERCDDSFKDGRTAQELYAELKKVQPRTEEIEAQLAELKTVIKEQKALDKAVAQTPYRLEVVYKPDFFSLCFDWSYLCKLWFIGACAIVILLNYLFSIPSFGVNMNNVLKFSDLRPGSYEVHERLDGTLEYTIIEGAAPRTIFDAIPSDEDALKALAYKLYQVGNKAMVSSPYAAYFETGVNDSRSPLADLPLRFRTIDIRNNITGEHFRETLQTLEPGFKLEGLAIIMGAFSVIGKRWYVESGKNDSTYLATIRTYESDGQLQFDWSKIKDTSSMSEDRKAIAFHPIPYTAAGYRGRFEGLDRTEAVAQTGTYWQYDEETGYSLPYYVDGAGRTIGFEKTDQHISYDPTHASHTDANGRVVEDYFTTIQDATVTYNAEGGFYTVRMTMDSNKEYTHIDTLWALRDAEGANDSSARFTKLEVEFELWDNGYFKNWKMWENWHAPTAYGMVQMSATQFYEAVFSYDENDCQIANYYQK